MRGYVDELHSPNTTHRNGDLRLVSGIQKAPHTEPAVSGDSSRMGGSHRVQRGYILPDNGVPLDGLAAEGGNGGFNRTYCLE